MIEDRGMSRPWFPLVSSSMHPLIKDGLTFDDVLLIPRHSKIKSRSNISLKVSCGSYQYDSPIIPANMKSVTGESMLHVVLRKRGLGLLHRFMPFEEQMHILQRMDRGRQDVFQHIGASIGVNDTDVVHMERLYSIGVRIFCIDIAHGDSDSCVEMCKLIAVKKDVLLIAGNIATSEAAVRLWNAGADIVKVGVGPGSLCTTRIETGNGVPQLTALMDVAAARAKHARKYIIADGGIKNAGDCVKALCFADMVMIGNLLAGTDETPADTIPINGKQFKRYDGSSTHKTNRIEGVTALVPSKGPVETVLTKLEEGIQSGCSYQGVDNLSALKQYVHMIRISNSGLRESHPHDVTVIE